MLALQVFTSAAAQSSFLTALSSSAATLTASAALALVTGAAAMLNDPRSLLNATAAADVRSSLLSAVSAAAANASSPAALQSAASAVSELVANPAQLSAAGAATALSVLAAISTAGSSRGVAVSLDTGVAVTAGLSSIATAAQSPGSAVSTGVLLQVSNVVDALATSQLTAMTVPDAPPVEVSSPAIQMRVSYDSADAGSRLFTSGISAAGSASAFAPMPAGVFGASAPSAVRTQFVSLAFDPWTAENTGVTRLAFSTASGAAVPVSGLRVAIYFTLPSVPGLVDGRKAQCQWYDTAVQNYSTVGCAAIPEPAPPGHTLTWAANFSVASDADMAAAWRIAGPLFDAAACTTTILDCSNMSSQQVIFPNPAQPFEYPGVTCNANISMAPMLVLSGSRCALLRKDNNASCYWDNVNQSFLGAGCVPSGRATACACRHLTDFAASSRPSIPVCSLSDLTSFSFGDIISKLTLLFEARARGLRRVHRLLADPALTRHSTRRPPAHAGGRHLVCRHDWRRAAGLRAGRPHARGRSGAPEDARGGLHLRAG